MKTFEWLFLLFILLISSGVSILTSDGLRDDITEQKEFDINGTTYKCTKVQQ